MNIFIFLLALLLALPAEAIMLIGFGGGGGGGLSYTTENFEGTGYQLGAAWTETLGGGTVNEDYTGDFYEGAQCLKVTGGVAASTYSEYDLGADYEEIWVAFAMRINTASSSERTVLGFVDSGGNDLARVRTVSSPAKELILRFGTANSGTTYNPGPDWIFYWVRFKAKTVAGNDGIIQIYSVATGETIPGTPNKSVTTGTVAGSVRKLRFGIGDSGDVHIDHIRIDDAAIGSNPS